MNEPSTRPVPVLTDGVVTLRAHQDGDAEAIAEQCADPESLRWTTAPRPYSSEDAREFIAANREAWNRPDKPRSWAIEWSGGGRARFAGTLDLRPLVVPDGAELGFGLHPDARGHGVMVRAVRLAAGFAFGTGPWGRPLSRIHWRALVGNWGSRRVAWATGFTMGGTLPGAHPDPEDHDRPGLDVWLAALAADDAMQPAAPWHEPAVLEGDSLRLRPWRDGDVEALEDRDDPVHWMPARSVLRREMFPSWLLRRRELMASGEAVEWCVADRDTDRALGAVTVFSRHGAMTGDTAELGYQLNPGARGRHVATEAARLAVGHALAGPSVGGLGMRRLVASTAADNVGSNRVLEANGFVRFGREHAVDVLADGTVVDELHWELVPGGQ